jgi:hypothetical protein
LRLNAKLQNKAAKGERKEKESKKALSVLNRHSNTTTPYPDRKRMM